MFFKVFHCVAQIDLIVNQNKTLCCQHKPISFFTRNECENELQDEEKRRYGVRYLCLKFTDQDVGLPEVQIQPK